MENTEGYKGLMQRVTNATRSYERKDVKTLLLDQLFDKLPRKEQIVAITEFLKNQEHYCNEKEVEELLLALEFLFSENEMRRSNEDEEIAFRKHLIALYQENEEKNWGSPFKYATDYPTAAQGLIIKLLEKILEGWSWKYDYVSPVAKRYLCKDACSCFSFVCDAYRNLKDKHGSDLEKAIKELFRKQIESGWYFEELNPWILRSPEDIAVVLLKQRTRLGGAELISEIELLENFDIQERSEEAISFIAGKMKIAREMEELAFELVKILLSKKITGLEKAEYSLLDEKTVMVHIPIEKKEKQKFDCLKITEAVKEERDRFLKKTGKSYKILIRVSAPGFSYQDPTADS